MLGGHVAKAAVHSQLHGQGRVRAERGDVVVGVDDLHFAVGLDVGRGDLALSGGLDIYGLRRVAQQAGNDALYVQNDLGNVLGHAGDGGKLMQYASDLDPGHRKAGQRGEKHAAKRVAKCRAVATFQRLNDELAVGLVRRGFDGLDTRPFYFDHVVPSFKMSAP